MRDVEKMFKVDQTNLVEIIKRNCDAPLQYALQHENSYFEQYPTLGYAALEAKRTHDDRDLLLLEMAVYAWMPQIMRSRPTSILTAEGLNELLSGKLINTEALVNFSEKTPAKNHSWVAFSKVLHFLEPEVFAIWDSRVASCFGLKWSSQWNKLEAYTSYLNELCKLEIETQAEVNEVKAHVSRKCGYEITTMRALELMLFLEGGPTLAP